MVPASARAGAEASLEEGERRDIHVVGPRSSGLPRPFGYYVGYQVAAEAARHHGLRDLAQLDNEHARPIVAKSVGTLVANSRSGCQGPTRQAKL